jgi:chemotaxis methyl-accepting protein methylase
VNVDVARAVRAERLNVLTSRWEAQYDLAIATNVLVYFNRRELSLALANISSMIRPGGYFLHNDGRPEIDVLAAASGLEALQARTVRVNTQMFDAFAIYRKAAYQ